MEESQLTPDSGDNFPEYDERNWASYEGRWAAYEAWAATHLVYHSLEESLTEEDSSEQLTEEDLQKRKLEAKAEADRKRKEEKEEMLESIIPWLMTEVQMFAQFLEPDPVRRAYTKVSGLRMLQPFLIANYRALAYPIPSVR